MTVWNELNAVDRPQGLPEAIRRQVAPGVYRYSFVHDDFEIDDPSLDANGRLFVSPREYGFAIRGFQHGKTAWARDFSNGTMLVVNADGQSHVLSAKVRARILFIGLDGNVLQDSAAMQRESRSAPELATVRLTVNVTFDLNGESPDTARACLIRSLEDAMVHSAALAATSARVVDHNFEQVAVVPEARVRSSDTDFSQLLDL